MTERPQISMTSQFTHIADVKVGRVKGNSRIYPQLRLPSQYAELAGKKASIYEIRGEDTAFIIRFKNPVAGAITSEKSFDSPVRLKKPCRGSDSGSNPDSGAPFLLSFDQRSFSAQGKECKLECKLKRKANHSGIIDVLLLFTYEDLSGYLALRAAGLTQKTVIWLKKAAELLWDATHGVVSVSAVSRLRDNVLGKYRDSDAKRKVLQFARAFLRYMSKISFDQRYAAFDLFLQLPRSVKEQKRVTDRIVTKEDVENVLTAIGHANRSGSIDAYHCLNYKAMVMFGAFTGQRPLATIARLTVGQFRKAVKMDKPVVDVLPRQDKIRMQHYCPLHPQVVEAIKPLLDSRRDNELIFEQLSFQQWLRHSEVRLLHSNARIVNGDLRKFAEQRGDIIQWDQSNRAYILTHEVSGVSWSHYRNPLPENVYDIYMKYWRNVDLTI
jgi:integrase